MHVMKLAIFLFIQNTREWNKFGNHRKIYLTKIISKMLKPKIYIFNHRKLGINRKFP